MVVSLGDWVVGWVCRVLVFAIITDNRNNAIMVVDRGFNLL